MCGIAGVASYHGRVEPELLDLMSDAIAHRGPDDSGTLLLHEHGLSVGLASRRLSILDLSAAGHMPMSTAGEELWIAYNGEIYNHPALRRELEAAGCRFRSRSDTETVLYAYQTYGLACLERLNGMFALAIYDRRRQELILARDRMGIKPLYYYWSGDTLIFGSELKSLLRHPLVERRVDPLALEIYITLGYVPSPHSLIRGVRKLEPGAALVLGPQGPRVEPYWRPRPAREQGEQRSPEQLARETFAVLDGAVQGQLMSDVPFGVMLSGGLDSTIVTSLVKRHHDGPLHTFSVGFHTGRSDLEAKYNLDRDHARLVAEELGTTHHEVTIDDDSALAGKIEHMLRMLDEPVWEPSYLSIYAMSQLARDHGIKVLLTGDGSDELFGGYPWYLGAQRLAMYEQIPFLRPVLSAASAVLPEGTLRTKVVDLRAKYRQPGPAKYLANYAHFSEGERRAFLSGGDASGVYTYIQQVLRPAEGASTANQFAFADTMLWVREHFNQRVDRMTMLASVEGRVPFQDNAVVDFALGLGMGQKILGKVQKGLLVNAFRGKIPDLVLNRAKRPFSAPSRAWLQGALKQYALAQLSEASVRELGVLDGRAVERFAHPLINEGFPDGERVTGLIAVWNLLALCVWMREWGVQA